jgi:hypothetical protein
MSQPQNTESGFDDPSLPQAPVASGNPDPGLYAGAGLTVSDRTEGKYLPTVPEMIASMRANLESYPQPHDGDLTQAILHLRGAEEAMARFFAPRPA